MFFFFFFFFWGGGGGGVTFWMTGYDNTNNGSLGLVLNLIFMFVSGWMIAELRYRIKIIYRNRYHVTSIYAMEFPALWTWGLSATNNTWWRHQIETFSALLAIYAGNSPASGEFPAQRPVTRSFDVFFDLCLNKRLRKQSRGWWFETLSCPLWRHRNEILTLVYVPLWWPFPFYDMGTL